MICQLEFPTLPLMTTSYSSQLSFNVLNHKAWLDYPACLPQRKTFFKLLPLAKSNFFLGLKAYTCNGRHRKREKTGHSLFIKTHGNKILPTTSTEDTEDVPVFVTISLTK